MTGKQRAFLRKLANPLDTIIYIGKEGITEHVVKEVYDALFRAKHSVELWDALATLCGGLMPLMPIVLIR